MAFLSKMKMAKRVAAIGVAEHPLLKETELAESEKAAYVEGRSSFSNWPGPTWGKTSWSVDPLKGLERYGVH